MLTSLKWKELAKFTDIVSLVNLQVISSSFEMISQHQKASAFSCRQERRESSSFGSWMQRSATSCAQIFHLSVQWQVALADNWLQALPRSSRCAWFVGSCVDGCICTTAPEHYMLYEHIWYNNFVIVSLKMTSDIVQKLLNLVLWSSLSRNEMNTMNKNTELLIDMLLCSTNFHTFSWINLTIFSWGF